MSTPTDPYNSASNRPYDDDALLEPLSDSLENQEPLGLPQDQPEVNYGQGDKLEWETVFAASDPSATKAEVAETVAPQPVAESPAEDFVPAPDVPATSDGDALVAESAGTSRGRHLPEAPAFLSAQETKPVAEREPLAEGETFASAYTATGTQEATPVEPVEKNEYGVRRESVFNAESEAPVAGATGSWGTGTAAATTPAISNLAELPDEPKKRVGAHIGSIFATLLLVPLVWYLLSDASVRLNLVENNPWSTGSVNIPYLLEFLGGLLLMLLLWLMARASSLGAQFWGFILTVGGIAALVVPQYATQLLAKLDAAIGSYNAFTGNVVHHLNLDLGSGRIAIYGFALFLTGIMIHAGRKSAGRRADALARRDLMLSK